MTVLASCHALPNLSLAPNPYRAIWFWVHPTSPNHGSSTQELPSSSVGCVSPRLSTWSPGTLGPAPTAASPLPVSPGRAALGAAQGYTLFLLSQQNKTAPGPFPVTFHQLCQQNCLWQWAENQTSKLTHVKNNLVKQKRLNPDLFTEGLMPPLYLCRARPRLSAETCIQFLCLLTPIQPIHFASHESTPSTRCRSPLSW